MLCQGCPQSCGALIVSGQSMPVHARSSSIQSHDGLLVSLESWQTPGQFRVLVDFPVRQQFKVMTDSGCTLFMLLLVPEVIHSHTKSLIPAYTPPQSKSSIPLRDKCSD